MPVKNNTEKGEVNMREHGAVYIPDDEYLERVKRAAKILQREGLDALIVNSNESDYANARYFRLLAVI